ncbi:MAG: hypothetical protein ACKV2Q_35040 [Planctomycetaceae bacterium]
MKIDAQNVLRVVRSCGVFLGVVIFVVTSTESCRATDDEAILAQVKAAWTERANAIGKVRYHLSGNATYLPGSLVPSGDPNLPADMSAANGLPEREATQPIRVVWTFDFTKSLSRKESWDWSYLIDRQTYRPIVRTDVFNGTELKGLIPREANTGGGHVPGPLDADFEIGSDSKIPRFFNLADKPVLFAHGLFQFVPNRLREGGTSILPPLTVLLHDVGTRDEPVVVLSAMAELPGRNKESFVEHEQRFWVDLTKNAAIVRWEDRFNSEVARRVTAQWQEHGQNWLPKSWTYTKFNVTNSGANPTIFYHYRVDRVELEPEVGPANFDIHYKAGMIVRRQADSARFQVAADGLTLRMVGPPPRSKTGTATTTPSGNGWWLVVCFVVAGLGLAVIYFRLRVRESH